MLVLTLYRTTIGKKVVMAVTGLVLVWFVVIHMLGNLHVYEGPEKLNAYGVFLREAGTPFFGHEYLLWSMRIILLGSVSLHILAAYQLTRLDLNSRPVGYRRRRMISASYAARTMRWSGVILALFVIYHILHFTTGTVHPGFRAGDIHGNVVAGFRVWYVSLFYVLAMVALGFHVYHGVWSMSQTLGLNNPARNRFWGGLATATAAAVTLGNISVPLAVLAGVVR
jgi:succinate dehydrogenase / fumarate reductase cytochrome b subunit